MSALVHGGNLKELKTDFDINELYDFSSNINPLGPPKGLIAYISENIKELLVLPEYDSGAAVNFVANFLSIDKKRIIPGSGTTEFIHRIPEILKPKKVLIAGPTYSDYEKACRVHCNNIDYINIYSETVFSSFDKSLLQKAGSYDLVYLCSPNNPTGFLTDKTFIKELCLENPDTFFVVDETYLFFEEKFKDLSVSDVNLDNLLVLMSFSKIFTLAGLRLGFLIIPSSMDKKLYDYPWKVNAISSGVCTYLSLNMQLVDEFLNETLSFIKEEKELFFNNNFITNNLELINSNNIYTLAKIKNRDISSNDMFDYFLSKKKVIRDCSNIKGLGSSFIRFSFRERPLNKELLNDFIKFFKRE